MASAATTMNDLPDVILSIIIAAVSDTRSRNAVALVCRKWLVLERATRASLSLRANVRDLVMYPNCFQSVTRLDLSLLSPWGHSLLATFTEDAHLLAQFLGRSFPAVAALTVYARTPATLEVLAPQWPDLTDLKLVRWHQRPSELPPAADFDPLGNHFHSLSSLDLSSFYCWTDDIPLALESAPNLAAKLTRLNLLNPSFAEGFKSDEIKTITAACRSLKEFLVACVFDHRYIGYVSDETLLSISANCSKLSLLHLVDASALLNPRGDPDDWGFTAEDARISPGALIDMFAALPLLEELTLDACKNVRESRLALEELNSKCPKLKSLKLGQFHGLCKANESTLDGIALCQGLESLSIKNSADLTDLGLIAIARGCSKLAKFEVQGCSRITVRGMGTLACLLRRTLVEVKISGCRNLGAVSSLKALEPVQDRIERLHMDCVWDSVEQSEALQGIEYNFDLNKSLEGGVMSQASGCQFADTFDGNAKKKCKYWYDLISSYMEEDAEIGNRRECETFVRTWERLRYLSIWIGVGELLSPLSMAGLENCPDLEEIWIRVEGDCRGRLKPSERAFGLSSLQRYPRLRKMHLNCGDIIGYGQTAPSGQMDLSLWERFYLFGIKNLNLSELDYWPPQDPDVNQRSLSLPAAGLLAQCSTLRKLFIHGTAHEHFLRMLLNIRSLRDVQLRGDYYPAPENDMSTEMRAVSCCRFEYALNMRRIDD